MCQDSIVHRRCVKACQSITVVSSQSILNREKGLLPDRMCDNVWPIKHQSGFTNPFLIVQSWRRMSITAAYGSSLQLKMGSHFQWAKQLIYLLRFNFQSERFNSALPFHLFMLVIHQLSSSLQFWDNLIYVSQSWKEEFSTWVRFISKWW